MTRHISRRSFLHYSALAGTAALTAQAFGTRIARAAETSSRGIPADLAIVTGSNYYDATVRAVDLMGGMTRFVRPGDCVGLLVNSRFTKPGTFIKPQITLAVIVMCRQAGATRIVSLEDTSARYWRHATLTHEHRQFIDEIRSPRPHRMVMNPGGVNVRRAEVVPDLLDCDVYINLPIFKDHQGIRFTGALKNLMGAVADRSNQTFHEGSDPSSEEQDEYVYLSHSIADANLLRRPTLSVGDATEILVQGGPYGPGPIRNFQTVIASTDPVALDACGADLLGVRPEDVLMLRFAQEHGIGTTDLGALTLVRESLGR